MRRRVKLTKSESGLLGTYQGDLTAADTQVLEAMADRLLEARVPGRRRAATGHLVLTNRQWKRRIAREMPMGGLIEVVSVNPGARFLSQPEYHPSDWWQLDGEDWDEDAV